MRYPLLRLLLRPTTLYAILLLFSIGLLVTAFDDALRPLPQLPEGAAAVESARQEHTLNLIALLLAAALGLLTGQAAAELRHCWFSWTLPGVRRVLLGAQAVTGTVISGLLAVGYGMKGGGVPAVPFFASSLLWFSLGASMEGVAFHFRFHRASWFNLAVLAGAVIAVDRIAEFSTARPVSAALLALMGVFLILFREFRIAASRAKLFVPSFSLLNLANSDAKQQFSSEVAALTSPSRRTWKVDLVAGSTRDWIRGSEYENYGASRGGWLRRAFVAVLLITVFTGAIAFQDGYETDHSIAQGLQYVYYPLFRAPSDAGPRPSDRPPYFLAYWMIAVTGWALAFKLTLFHRTQAIPLSRNQRARVAYWSSLIQNLGIALLFGLLLFALGAVAVVFGPPGGDLSTPVYMRALAMLVVLAPISQWLSLKYHLDCSGNAPQRLGMTVWILGMILAAMAVTGAGYVLAKWSLGAALEVMLLLALVAISQWGWRAAIQRHFRTADLV